MPLFADLDRLRANLDALRPLAPEQEARVLQKFRLEWNYNSNAIEGNSLTLGETRSLLLHGLTAAGKPLRDHLDIKGHNEAVLWLEDFVRDERPLTEQFIRGMHEVLLGEPYEVQAQTADGQPTRKLIVPGRYKTSPNNVLTATGEMFYFASPEETPGRMTDLVDWYRAEEAAPTLPPVALATEFHYRFVRIHPFEDGNGRMARLLMNLILLRHGYPMTVIPAADRNRYLAALAEADAGEPEPFLRFIIENVEASLRLMIRAARGESIDEPGDLDKKLALLRKQVVNHDKFEELTWNSKTQSVLYDSLVQFWFNDFGTLVEKFNEFFQISKVEFYCAFFNATNVAKPRSSTDLQSAIESASERFKSLGALDILQRAGFYFEWNNFRGLKTTFGQRANLTFIFKERQFEVDFAIYADNDSGTPEKIFTSDYSTLISSAEVHTINHQLADKIYNFIEAKLAKANTSPA